ncbi:hypothetical protein ACO0KY_02790 [Undibacterium sp. Dicai25W]|uniref:hypothetical protein n=1 Tax=Undibacterium sp. Dicai25W TaxID=3413034 RepID=UPI003BF390A3
MKPAVGVAVYSVWQTPQGIKLGSAYRQAAEWIRGQETFSCCYHSNINHLNSTSSAAYFALLQRIYPNDDGEPAMMTRITAMNGLE